LLAGVLGSQEVCGVHCVEDVTRHNDAQNMLS
jgi:hypothetical protein